MFDLASGGLCWATDVTFGLMAIYYDHILGIYRLYRGTLVSDDDFGKMTIY